MSDVSGIVAELIMPEHVYGIITEIIGKLESSSLKAIKWIRIVKDELKAIHETLLAINRILLNAQEQQLTNTAVRKWLQDLKSIAVDIEDEIDLILTQHALSLKVKENGTTLYHRFPGSRKAQKLKSLGQKLDEVDHNRRQFNLQEQPTIPQRSSLFWYLAKELREKNWEEAWNAFGREGQLRVDDNEYMLGLPLTLEEERMRYPKFLRYNEYDLYRIQNCRVSENRRR